MNFNGISVSKESNTPNFYFFDWHRVSKAFAPTISKGAQALGKEFPASAPHPKILNQSSSRN
jgi:hypothetical protein